MSNSKYSRALKRGRAVGLMVMLAAFTAINANATGLFSATYFATQEGQRMMTSAPPKNSNAARKSGIIRQTSDVTCGPAALASLLTFHLGEETSEHEIARLSGTYERGTSTLLGLRNAARAKGYEAVGYRMTFSALMQEVETSGVPVLVHFKEPSLHYALVLGRVDDFVLVADPSRGNVSMHVGDFSRRWDNNALVVRTHSTVDPTRLEKRKRSTATRIETLSRESVFQSSPRF